MTLHRNPINFPSILGNISNFSNSVPQAEFKKLLALLWINFEY